MVTRDVFQVLKLHSPAARAILRTFKTSLVPIYHVMHSRFPIHIILHYIILYYIIMAFVGILSQIKFLFEPLVIQLVWYILTHLFTSVSVKVVNIYLAASGRGKYPLLFTSTSVNNC